MFKTLRTRLLASYLFIVGLTLAVMALILLFIASRSQIPSRQVYLRLVNTAQANRDLLTSDSSNFNETLAQIAVRTETRIFRLSADGSILFDSMDGFATGDILALEPAEGIGQDRLSQRLGARGTYHDERGAEWLYISYPANPRQPDELILLSALRPTVRLSTFVGDGLFVSFAQAGCVGVIIALLLAAAISQSVARPLKESAQAARALAAGDYSKQAPEKGPQEVQDLAHAFNEMSEQIQQARQMQRDFLANVSHELKTPLTSIQGYSQAILDGATANPTHSAQVIYDEAGRLHRLVEELLDLARIESGQTRLRFQPVNLLVLIEAVMERMALKADRKGISLYHELGSLPDVIGDGDRLAQVFTNLIDNAIAHTPSGGQISVNGREHRNGILVAVSDTGQGIPVEDLSRVFERFYQVDKSRSRADKHGTGLGLTISREIVAAHRGIIRAENAEGGGARFSVWLPLPGGRGAAESYRSDHLLPL